MWCEFGHETFEISNDSGLMAQGATSRTRAAMVEEKEAMAVRGIPYGALQRELQVLLNVSL